MIAGSEEGNGLKPEAIRVRPSGTKAMRSVRGMEASELRTSTGRGCCP
jgi:hypothetical protein